jgi:prepilin-type N-terminal cleavage/methylation domain-containing protein
MPAALNRAAFTLLEVMIAIALGTLVVLIAASGFRSAAQAVALAQRLVRANDLAVAGMMVALDEADYWDTCDDPGDTNLQRLRESCALPVGSATGNAVRLGLPFAPFARQVGAHQAVWAPGTPQGFGHGWQDDERLWAVAADNELTWWPGNKAETQESDCRFGHYAIFGISRLPGESAIAIDGGTSGAVGGWQPRNGGGVYGTVDFGAEPPPPPATAAVGAYRHRTPGWFYNQLRGLSNSLGWYGMLDYLPANAIVCYSTRYLPMAGVTNWPASNGDCTDAAGRPIFLIKTFARAQGWQFADKPYFILQSFSPNWAPHAADFLTAYTAYGLVPGRDNALMVSNWNPTTQELVFHNRSVGRMESTDLPIGSWGFNSNDGYVEPAYPTGEEHGGDDVFRSFVARTTAVRRLMPVRPATWPDVSVSTARYLRLNRASTQFKVSWDDPLTGERADLRFTAIGTTLRGARRRRGLDR